MSYGHSNEQPSRVLVANKFWYLRGGLERVMFDEIGQLAARGVEVAHFSMDHPDNDRSPWESYFAPHVELGKDADLSAWERFRAAANLFWNREAAARFGRLLNDFGPELVHVHGVHRQLSPSILFAARERGIPVVQTLHDAHHVCPADVLLRGGDSVCLPRACGKHNFLPAVTNRCVRGSVAASALSAAETAWQRTTGTYQRTVTRFIAPSHHLARVMHEGGWAVTPIDIIPNGITTAFGSREAGDFLFIAGRLSPEKGVDLALEAAARLDLRIVVAGDGPESERLRSRFPAAEFLGHVTRDVVAEYLARCTALLLTSCVPENAPMSLLEAMASGVPVVAPRLGGVPEIVEDGVSGLLFTPGEIDELVGAVRRLAEEPGLAETVSEAARKRVERCFTLERHTDLLLKTYAAALSTEVVE